MSKEKKKDAYEAGHEMLVAKEDEEKQELASDYKVNPN